MIARKKYKKAIILGARGFIGTNLSHALIREGLEVVCCARTASPNWPQAARFIEFDFAYIKKTLLDELNDAFVFHLVSSSHPSIDTALVSTEIATDIAGTAAYLEATKTRDLRWIFLSSGGTVYGQHLENIRETGTQNPICSYGLTKLVLEKYFGLYHKIDNLDFVVARLSNPYGPWQNPLLKQGIIAALIYKALKGEEIEIWGDGSTVRDYLYIADAVQGIVSAASVGQTSESYNISSGLGVSINQLIKAIEPLLGIALRVNYTSARIVDVPKNVLNNEKAYSQLDWSPEITLQEGIVRTHAWIRDQLIKMKF